MATMPDNPEWFPSAEAEVAHLERAAKNDPRTFYERSPRTAKPAQRTLISEDHTRAVDLAGRFIYCFCVI